MNAKLDMSFFPQGLRIGSYFLAVFLLCSCATGEKIAVSPADLTKFQQRERNGVIRVEGCVYHPGDFSLKPGQTITLSEALKKAGGAKVSGNPPEDFDAALGDVIVKRYHDGSFIQYKLNLLPGQSGANFTIERGDMIYVPELVF